MIELTFKVTEARKRKVNMRARVALQKIARGKEPNLEGVIDLLAVFIVDDKGEYYGIDDARARIEELDEDELKEAADKFVAAFSEDNLPKAKSKR